MKKYYTLAIDTCNHVLGHYPTVHDISESRKLLNIIPLDVFVQQSADPFAMRLGDDTIVFTKINGSTAIIHLFNKDRHDDLNLFFGHGLNCYTGSQTDDLHLRDLTGKSGSSK